MKVNRWLAIFLLASWTLNVALIVVLFLGTRSVPGEFRRGDIPPPPMYPGEQPMFMRHFENLRDEMAPLVQRRAFIVDQMAETFEADVLDTALMRSLGDSLIGYHSSLHNRFMDHLFELHGDLSPEMRKKLSRRITRHMGGEVSPQFIRPPDMDKHRMRHRDVPRYKRNQQNSNNEGD